MAYTGEHSSSLPIWVLAMAGASIVLGLMMYGRRVMETIGVSLRGI
jgi:phosphate/sulfate permease